ncbi:helix-turn-helix transcriptional regulator [Streptomyces sp. NBC_00038]|uniref:helix-turn-helix domain-containing protein n=1 Tax=Streptomyces sp. NBC_00038 TaxID=2903615 RepID=UPI0022550A7C|nr:helix-turn-helix transcriptional regulator [Streptomyces sp. NBC_00038]MCX5558919.1 helix-turn-helix transcriptional regulator [Streptomyces sp. NBC_00038]
MAADDDHEGHDIEVHLDRLLSERGMTVTELASRVGVTNVNLSVLKNGRAKAIRFTTLTRICEVLQCQPGDLLSYRPGASSEDPRKS